MCITSSLRRSSFRTSASLESYPFRKNWFPARKGSEDTSTYDLGKAGPDRTRPKSAGPAFFRAKHTETSPVSTFQAHESTPQHRTKRFSTILIPVDPCHDNGSKPILTLHLGKPAHFKPAQKPGCTRRGVCQRKPATQKPGPTPAEQASSQASAQSPSSPA